MKLRFRGQKIFLALCLAAFCLPPISCARGDNSTQLDARWQNRNAPDATEKTAREFLNLLVLDGSIDRPQMREVVALAKQGQSTQALEKYAAHFLARLQNPRQYGLAAAMGMADDADSNSNAAPQQIGANKLAALLAKADQLMNGTVVLNKDEIALGEPGSTDWNALCENKFLAAHPAAVGLHDSGAFLPLTQAYFQTSDRKYWDKWVGYLDDWSLRNPYFDRLHPLLVPDTINADSAPVTLATLKVIGRAQALMPAGQQAVPPRVLAQLIRRFLLEFLPYRISYIRSNTHNWTPSTELMQVAQIFDEFKAAPIYFREARRRDIEDNAVTQNLRDGTETQQDHWYNVQYLHVAEVFDLLKSPSAVAGWNALREDEIWNNEIREHLKERATWLIHDRTPQNLLPIPWAGGYKRTPETATPEQSPEAYQDPQNVALLKAAREPQSGVTPNFTDEWFPYGGYNIVRGDWKRAGGYGALFCSPHPGAYGGYRSRSNNNTFGLNAYGQDLLIDDSLGHYMYPSSPVTVDGRNQFFHAGVYKVGPPSAHKVFQVNAWWQPANWRWHSSQNFSLMEGVYSGAFGNPNGGSAIDGPYGKDESDSESLAPDSAIRDVTHQRLATYVRGHNFWIITDRLQSKSTHRYEQSWLIPIRPEGVAFDPEKILTDAAQKKIWTDQPQLGQGKKATLKANLSLYQFTPATLEYSSQVVPRKEEYGRLLYYGWDRVRASWSGSGAQQIVTLVFPRAPGTGAEGDLKSVKQITSGKAATGFEAALPDGATIRYLAAPQADDDLKIGDVSMRGESLLLSDNGGMALGCTALSIGGKTVKLSTPDFEFALNSGNIGKITPIYRPIDPVEIGPARNVFANKIEVSLSSKTPSVQFHYTTDGTEPTPQSNLYSGPFSVTKSAVVKARAYRAGVTENPPQTSGTMATPTSTAVFTKQELSPAKSLSQSQPGLQCEYFEGDWRALFFRMDELKPQAEKVVPRLWDLSAMPPGDDARKKFYALQYNGFLDVPQDGVYTFQAPNEFIWPATEAGYELRVYVDGNEWYPSTRIHAFGNWSIALQKGAHAFKVAWIDYRTDAAERLNKPNLNEYIWSGKTPDFRITGGGIENQPIPASWLLHSSAR